MGISIDQQVINYVARYVGPPASAINSSTTFSSLGINTITDVIDLITACEDNFGLVYQTGDEKGINTVGDLTALIKKKLGNSD